MAGDLTLDVAFGALSIRSRPAVWPDHRGAPVLMLAELMRYPNQLWRRDRLMTALGMWNVTAQILTVYAVMIRRAIASSQTTRLLTARGKGYVLEVRGSLQ